MVLDLHKPSCDIISENFSIFKGKNPQLFLSLIYSFQNWFNGRENKV